MKGTIWVVVRLLLTAALVLVTCLGVQAMKSFLTLPPIRQLSLDISRLPIKLGEWRGEECKLDAETFDRTGADVAVNRQYRDDQDHSVTMLLALYRTDPDAGVYHAPTNCYRSNGWRLVSESTVEVPISKEASQRVDLSTWEKRGETILVMFWYRLGDYTLFERWDMGKVRWAMRGQKSWPPLVKVLLQTPTSRGDEFYSKARIQEMAARIQTWLNQSNAGDKPRVVGK